MAATDEFDLVVLGSGGAGCAAAIAGASMHLSGAMRARGVRLRLALGLPDYFYPAGPGSCADGRRMVEPELIARSALEPWSNSIRRSIHNVPGVAWSDSV